MGRRKNLKKADWLKLVKEAIDEGVKIQVNHRFRYKGKNMGTFLTSIKSKNDQETMDKILKLGFDFRMHSNKPKDLIYKFIQELINDPNPIKTRYITRFNQYIFPKKDEFDQKTIDELNVVWRLRFGDERKWKNPTQVEERVEKWKEFRYNKELNPKGKWFRPKSKMGKQYDWVYGEKKWPHRIEAIRDLFSDKEIEELKSEGFFEQK